jgi:hypothetical protein
MKSTFLILAPLFFLFSCSCDENSITPLPKPDPAEDQFGQHFPTGSPNIPFPDEVSFETSKPKSLRIKTIYYYDNPNSGSPTRHISLAYDSLGNLIKEEGMHVPGFRISYITYEYNNGKRIKRSIFDVAGENLKVSRSYVYVYDNNKLVREDTFFENGIKAASKYYIYARNRLVHLYSEGSEGDKTQYKYYYDSKGRCIKEERYRGSSLLTYTLDKTYDDADRIQKIKTFQSKDITLSSEEYKYILNQRQPAEIVYYDNKNAFVMKVQWAYNENELPLSKWQADKSGNLYPLEKNTYENGVIKENRRFDPVWNFQETTRTRYEYEPY